jgi:hypothetical protein
MHRNAENKLFLTCKTNNFSKRFFFFSDLLRFYAINDENFHLDLQATYTRHALQKLMQKTSFQATDATTKSSNQEDNENKKNFFFIYLLRNNATRENDDKIKTKRMKRKLWLKAQITYRIRAQK